MFDLHVPLEGWRCGFFFMSGHAWEFVDGVSFDIRVPLMSTVPRNFGAEDMTCDQALVISMVESHRRA
ncbi:unnamed protein product [Ilex paraguariensis]|uniref:Uncharacterized protein n=1 Tax=Ilex paraguariensis TaxID=185542 RepID=A0ABC8V2Y1_9AQUA